METLAHQFLQVIETYLRRTGTKPTEFGRMAAGDPSLVLNLRRGRSPRSCTVDRVLSYIRSNGSPGARISVTLDGEDR